MKQRIEVKNQIYSLTDCIEQELIIACHDISEGGIAAALSEMTFEYSIGCDVKIDSELSIEKTLFSETGGFVLEADNNQVESIRSVFRKRNLNIYVIGKTGGNRIQIHDTINILIEEAKTCWENGLKEKL